MPLGERYFDRNNDLVVHEFPDTGATRTSSQPPQSGMEKLTGSMSMTGISGRAVIRRTPVTEGAWVGGGSWGPVGTFIPRRFIPTPIEPPPAVLLAPPVGTAPPPTQYWYYCEASRNYYPFITFWCQRRLEILVNKSAFH